MNYKISIIVPVFNVEDYIEESLESIIGQTIGFENLEVIMVNDCSTDNSGKIIDKYSENYENFISIHLDENSEAAGKPRNVGINLAKGKYLMFLDPDDYYNFNSCEILYNKIEEEKLDMVTGEYDVIYENNEKENVDYPLYRLGDNSKYSDHIGIFFGAVPAIWTKIIRKDFVTKNKITFPEKIPAQDLVFYIHSLLKTSKITFIKKIITTYRKREKLNKSLTNSITEKYMYGLITAYKQTYELCKKENKEELFQYVVRGHLTHWCRQLILSDLTIEEKINLLKDALILFKVYKKFNVIVPDYLSGFFSEIQNENFKEAAIISNKMKSDLEKEIEESKMKRIEKYKIDAKKNIFLICDKIPVEMGGLSRIVLHKAKYFHENGNNVKILTIDDADYSEIKLKLREQGYLSPSIDLINIHSYYEEKNTEEPSSNYISLNKKETEEKEEYLITSPINKNKNPLEYYYNGCHVKTKIWKNKKLFIVIYFDENGRRIREKKFKNGFVYKITSYFNHDQIRSERYFTKDGFCYLTKFYDHRRKLNKLLLFNKNEKEAISLKNETEFYKHFFTNISKSMKNKPFLICEGSGPTPKISNIDSKIAYKISSLHSNPYLGNYSYGSKMRPVGVLEDVKNIDALVSLTKKQRLDLLKEFGDYNNSFSIPNFVPFIENKNIKKKRNKITVISRIAIEKRLDHAIKAFKLVVNKKPEAILEIYGRATLPREKEELEKINTLIENLNLENNVFIKGYTTNVYDKMAESVATLLTSRFEGFAMAILESMMNSTPVISYDLNYGSNEIIDHGNNGYLVKYSDIKELSKYILKLLEDPDKAIEMGKNARKTALTKFSAEVVMKKWEELLENVPNIEKNETAVKIVNKIDTKSDLNNNIKLKNKIASNLYFFYIIFNRRNNGLKNIILNIRGYRSIKKNNLFDYDFYLKNNPKVKAENMDPILHYIYYGAKAGKNPNKFFDNKYYLNNNSDVKKSKINPFVHYNLFGRKENRKTKKN